MSQEVLVKRGTPIVFADATDFVATVSGFTRTAQIDLTSVANSAARQSDKVDLGATRAALYQVRTGLEFAAAVTAGLTVEVYWSGSASATAGTGNDGDCTGADGAYKSASLAELNEWVAGLQFLGCLKATNDGSGVVQIQTIGRFSPGERYGQIVVANKSGQALQSDAVEMFVALIPVVDEIQDAP